ncbi:hypothetical protein DYU05_03210 [Mucilaginibacter terrenus]|uniref:Uncharacterized protein n=1 Tax=Mucilaginibacter terrenus TaxID=2482727 RepID=A0A3E2NUK8_9SPHI|nr:hypothetical protein [Mucilaginibacter terrenus]RFZ84637.1 hypothetical protein DYU05_03210 [Mucilaginibacter terrenus]
MNQDYLQDKTVKKKSAVKAAYLLVLAGIAIVIIVAKIAGSGSLPSFNGLPTSDAAYSIAKVYIRPTVRSNSVSFEDGNYKFAKKSDSVYVIKSSYTAKGPNGEKSTTNFTISLRYLGGNASSESSWSMLDLNQD